MFGTELAGKSGCVAGIRQLTPLLWVSMSNGFGSCVGETGGIEHMRPVGQKEVVNRCVRKFRIEGYGKERFVASWVMLEGERRGQVLCVFSKNARREV
jgi:hypothetical protein